jgi:hypothetical protein
VLDVLTCRAASSPQNWERRLALRQAWAQGGRFRRRKGAPPDDPAPCAAQGDAGLPKRCAAVRFFIGEAQGPPQARAGASDAEMEERRHRLLHARELDRMVQEEQLAFGDIVKVPAAESYYAISRKTADALAYGVRQTSASFVMKV